MDGKWRQTRWSAFVVVLRVAFAASVISAEQGLMVEDLRDEMGANEEYSVVNYVLKSVKNLLWQSDAPPYHHVWPPMEFGWQIVLGTLIGFFGAAFGSVGGVGGGGFFIPMLTLIIGFDPKSSTAISKWTSSKAFIKGVDTWNRETVLKKEAARLLESTEYRPLAVGPSSEQKLGIPKKDSEEVSIIDNVCWKEFGLLVSVWFVFLTLQVAKHHTSTCSVWYWVLNALQIPVSVAVTLYEAVSLYKGKRVIASKGDEGSTT